MADSTTRNTSKKRRLAPLHTPSDLGADATHGMGALIGPLQILEMACHDVLLAGHGRQPAATDTAHHRAIDLDGHRDRAESLRRVRARRARPGSLEKHGNPNVVTLDRGTSQLAQSTVVQTVLVQVERFESPPPVTAFDPPKFAHHLRAGEHGLHSRRSASAGMRKRAT